MKKLMIFLLVLCLFCMPFACAEEAQEVLMAPEILVYDGEGNEVLFSEVREKCAVLNFWATWCGPCKGELPFFEEMYKKYGEDVQFFMIDLTDGSRDTVESVKAFIEENGYTFPVYYDSEGIAAYVYGISSIPVTVFVNADGEFVRGYVGALDEEVLEQELTALIGTELTEETNR